MLYTKKTLAGLLLTAVLAFQSQQCEAQGVTKPEASDQTTSCSIIQTDPRTVPVDPDPLGLAPSGAEDQLSTLPTTLRPVDPAFKTCESGRIFVQVATQRYYGNHIGDQIMVSVKIVADDGVMLDLSTLDQGILGLDGSDFALVPTRAVKVSSMPSQQQAGVTVYDLELPVQSFSLNTAPILRVDLKYALDVPAGETQPNWRRLTTPDFVINMTPVISRPEDDEIQEGDLSLIQPRSPWTELPLMVLGVFLIVWFGLASRLVVHFNRVRPRRKVPPAEQAWLVFDKVFSDAIEYGEFGDRFLRKIDAALRRYIAQITGLNVQALTIDELKNSMPNGHYLTTLVSALEKCESVIFAPANQPRLLSEEQVAELRLELTKLVGHTEK